MFEDLTLHRYLTKNLFVLRIYIPLFSISRQFKRFQLNDLLSQRSLADLNQLGIIF